MTKGSDEAQRSLELLKRRNWRWGLVYGPSGTTARKRAQEGLGFPAFSLLMKLRIVLDWANDNVKHIGQCQGFDRVSRQLCCVCTRQYNHCASIFLVILDVAYPIFFGYAGARCGMHTTFLLMAHVCPSSCEFTVLTVSSGFLALGRTSKVIGMCGDISWNAQLMGRDWWSDAVPCAVTWE